MNPTRVHSIIIGRSRYWSGDCASRARLSSVRVPIIQGLLLAPEKRSTIMSFSNRVHEQGCCALSALMHDLAADESATFI